MSYTHEPVLPDECTEALKAGPGMLIIDGTAGLGGHSEALLRAGARVVCVDKDGEAQEIQKKRLAPFGDAVAFVREDFRHIGAVLDGLGHKTADGVLLDLGVSSLQLDKPERGFSYHGDAALDMRMDRRAGMTAADIVNTWPPDSLKRILYDYGEERYAPQIAAAMAAGRPVETTAALRDIILKALPAKARREERNPCRRVFQALRIAVNDELGAVEEGVAEALERLSPGGRMAVISFHSLEDRIVKRIYAAWARGCVCPADFPACVCGKTPRVRLLGQIRPGREEVGRNPRAQSATLRIAEKI